MARRKATAPEPQYNPKAVLVGAPTIPDADSLRRVDDEALEWAHRAIAKARSMVPAMEGFVRLVTGRTVKVIVRADLPASCTDGDVVYIKPDIRLGMPLPHPDPDACSKRDSRTLARLCDSCAVIETVTTSLFHEAAHIAFDSFVPMSDDQVRLIIRRIAGERGLIAAHQWQTFERDMERGWLTIPQAMGMINPVTKDLWNALEDARVNRQMFRERPGLRDTFQAKVNAVFRSGIKLEDGTSQLWSEAPLDMQAIIGCYLMASGYHELLSTLSDEVQPLFKDGELGLIIMGLGESKSAEHVYVTTFGVLNVLRRYGFCLPEESELPPMGGQPGGEGMPSPQQGGQGESSDPDQAAGDQGDDQGGDQQGDGAGDDQGDQQGDQGDQQGDQGDQQSDQGDQQGDQQGAGDDQGDQAGAADQQGAGDQQGDQQGAGDQQGDQQGAGDQGDQQGAGSDQGDQGDQAGAADQGDQAGAADQAGDQGAQGGAAGVSADQQGDQAGGDRQALDQRGGADQAGDQKAGRAPMSDKDIQAMRDAMRQLTGHEADGKVHRDVPQEFKGLDSALRLADVQFDFFESPSAVVAGVTIHHPLEPTERGNKLGMNADRLRANETWYGDNKPLDPSLLGRTVLKARMAFGENQAIDYTRGHRRGAVDTNRLASVVAGEQRVFMRRSIPDHRDYFALLGLDISGSTGGERIVLIKQIGRAMGEIFSRIGVQGAVYCHTAAGSQRLSGRGYDVDLFEIQGPDEPWGPRCHQRLDRIAHGSQNLDGHTLETYRKIAERRPERERVIFYLTDGQMPAANREEELVVLQREIALCRKLGITLVGIGAFTDSPKEHGLDTIQIDSPEELPRLIEDVRKRIVRR